MNPRRVSLIAIVFATAISAFAAEPSGLPDATAGAAPTPGFGATTPGTGTVTDYKKFRDPFKEPAVAEIQETRSELERYAVTDFKVVAVITGPLRMRAMLLGPDSKTHYVSEKMKIGLRDGVITKITTKSIVVREKVVNPLGEVEYFDTEIAMDQPAMAGAQTQ